MKIPENLDASLAAQKLFISGQLSTVETDGFSEPGTILLISPQEPEFWPHFKKSPEFNDGAADPMDRWSKAALDPIAEKFGCTALYPSDGPPFPAFFSWALRSGQFWGSPISFLVHETAGLFASFRGALYIPVVQAETTNPTQPCNSCDQPCRTACPVEAFANGFDVNACKTYLRSAAGKDCMTNGCKARRACPVGQGLRIPEQAQFHMDAFL